MKTTTDKEDRLKNKIINALMSSHHRMQTLEKVWKLVKGEWQK